MIELLLEPFEYAFVRHGVMVATIAGALCGLVGVYVVLRGMSYIGHGLSHAIFGGAVVSFVLTINFYVGAAIWGLCSASLINGVSRRRTIGADAAIGVVTTASFAIGLALISRYRSFTRNFDAALFGKIVGVEASDVWVVAGAALLAVAVIAAFYRPLLFTAFDPEVAEVSGVRTRRIDALFSFVLAITIISTMRVMGVMLVAAALVIPAVVSRLLTDSFARMLWYSAGIGAACGFVGFNLSYHLDLSAGASIVLVGAALFGVVFAVTGARGRMRAASLAHV